jgi:hypothetical protein
MGVRLGWSTSFHNVLVHHLLDAHACFQQVSVFSNRIALANTLEKNFKSAHDWADPAHQTKQKFQPCFCTFVAPCISATYLLLAPNSSPKVSTYHAVPMLTVGPTYTPNVFVAPWIKTSNMEQLFLTHCIAALQLYNRLQLTRFQAVGLASSPKATVRSVRVRCNQY